MEQFSLEKYLENPNRKVVTRDGRSARIICTNRLDENYPVIALVNNEDSEGCCCYTTFGKLYAYKNRDCEFDLFFAPEKKSAWINLYKMNSIISPGPRAYDTKEEAESAAGDKSYYISTIKIEWEE
jgi:hypothetical protein